MAYSDPLLSEQINYTLQMVTHSEFNENDSTFLYICNFASEIVNIYKNFFEYLQFDAYTF